MKEILNILANTPINKLAEIDPKLAGLVLRAIDSKPIGIKRYARGQEDILFNPNGYDYGEFISAGWTHKQMVEQGYAKWL